MKRSLLWVALVAAPVLQAADTWTIDKNHSEVAFQVRHVVTQVRGNFVDFEGTIVTDAAKPEASSVEFKVKTTSINTNNANRDKHLRSPDFFDVEKFPELTFKSTKVQKTGTDTFDVTGDLTMHGVTKSATLPVKYLGSAAMRGKQKAGFELTATLNRKDYGINWNGTLDQGGFVLGDDVKVQINLEVDQVVPAAPAATPAK